MSMNQSDVDRLRRAVAAALREHWMLFVVEGIVLLAEPASEIWNEFLKRIQIRSG